MANKSDLLVIEGGEGTRYGMVHDSSAPLAGLRKSVTGVAKGIGRGLIPVVAILTVWELGLALSSMPPFVLPRPEQVIAAMIADKERIADNVWSTLFVAGSAYVIANCFAVSVAVLLLYFRSVEKALMPILIWTRTIPYVALAPILLLMIGDTPVAKMLVAILASYFVVLINTLQGLRRIDQVVLDRMRILNASEWQVFWRVRFFFALDHFIAAQKLVVSSVIMATIASEWLLSASGMGYLINRYLLQYKGDGVYGIALFAATFAIVLFSIVEKAESSLLPWKENKDV